MAALCTVCSNSDESVEFNTVGELLAHTKNGHVSRPEKKLPPPRKPVTPSATELKAGVESVEQGQAPATPTITEASKPDAPPKPIELHYKWTGVHAPCGSEPRTIVVPAPEGKVVAVAFCVNCDIQLADRTVPAIPADKTK